MSDDRPKAARLYDVEHTELSILVQSYALALRDGDEGEDRKDLDQWLDTTLYMHREQARAEGYMEYRDTHKWGTWWERNWFGVVMIALIGGGMVLIGLVNGWS